MCDLLPEDEGYNMPLPCEQENNISEIKGMLNELTREFRGLLGEMRSAFVEDREHKIKIEQLQKGQDVLFDKLREIDIDRALCVKEKIEPLVTFKNKMEGSFAMMKAIPIGCVIITTIMAVWTFSMSIDTATKHTHEPVNSKTYGVTNGQ